MPAPASTAPTDARLFEPVQLGELRLANRIAMAPLTRNRAAAGRVPGPLAQTYYAQRASAGLLITEATQISPLGQGYLDTPGLYSPEQVEGWKAVTRAVHAAGGTIVVQLWHVGRISHVSLLPPGEVPVAPSAIRAKTKTFTANGFEDVGEPRALRLDELPALVADYRRAAANAIEAGFDGVEIHAANGYLLDQFLRDGSNHRTDAYGGPIEHRARLLIEVVEAITQEIGAGRTGIRLSPVTPANDASDSDPQPLFEHVCERLGRYGLAYVHVIEGATGGARDVPAKPGRAFDYAALRRLAKAPWMVNNGYDRALAFEAVDSGAADVVAFGRPYIGNPDLVERLKRDAPLAVPDRATFYGGGAHGYTDYPTLA